jgi:predicted nucleotidyltransferase
MRSSSIPGYNGTTTSSRTQIARPMELAEVNDDMAPSSLPTPPSSSSSGSSSGSNGGRALSLGTAAPLTRSMSSPQASPSNHLPPPPTPPRTTLIPPPNHPQSPLRVLPPGHPINARRGSDSAFSPTSSHHHTTTSTIAAASASPSPSPSTASTTISQSHRSSPAGVASTGPGRVTSDPTHFTFATTSHNNNNNARHQSPPSSASSSPSLAPLATPTPVTVTPATPPIQPTPSTQHHSSSATSTPAATPSSSSSSSSSGNGNSNNNSLPPPVQRAGSLSSPRLARMSSPISNLHQSLSPSTSLTSLPTASSSTTTTATQNGVSLPTAPTISTSASSPSPSSGKSSQHNNNIIEEALAQGKPVLSFASPTRSNSSPAVTPSSSGSNNNNNNTRNRSTAVAAPSTTTTAPTTTTSTTNRSTTSATTSTPSKPRDGSGASNGPNNPLTSPRQGQNEVQLRAEKAPAAPFSDLHFQVLELVEEKTPTDEEAKHREDLTMAVASIIHSKWSEVEVHRIGSSATGTYLPESDIDLVVRYIDPSKKLGVGELYALADLLAEFVEDRGDVNVISTASVPLIKMRDRQTGYYVDISFNIDSGLQSTVLVMDYLDEYPNLKPLVMLLKLFLQVRGLNCLYTGIYL